MKLHQLANDYDVYPETAGHWLVVSDDLNDELSKPFPTKEDAKLEMAKLSPDHAENIISIKIDLTGKPNVSYLGTLAVKASYSVAMQAELDALFQCVKHKKTNNHAWIFLYERGEYVLKVGQPTKQQAAMYLQKNAVLVFFWEE